MADQTLRNLSRAYAANPSDAELASRFAVALVRAGRLPFADFITAPTQPWGNWGAVDFGPVRLSIQAGYGKYSAPRRDGLAAADYSEWELAIVGETGLIAVLDSTQLAGMPYASHWEGERVVGPYVPTEGVQAIFDFMVRTYGAPRGVTLALRD